MRWFVPETEGTPPKPRYQHSMEFIGTYGCIAILGGRETTEPAGAEVWLLHLKKLEWVKVKPWGFDARSSRIAHSVAWFNTKLVVLGGI